MAKEKLVEFLQRAGFINASQASDIAESFTHRMLHKSDFLLHADSVSDAYLFLDSGLLRAFVYDTEGNEVTTGFYSGGQIAFEASSFFNRTPSQQYMQALTECSGWLVTHQQFNALFHARPEFREFGRSVLVRTLASMQERMLDQIRETATARYEKLMKASPEVLQYAPLKHIASYLGVTDTSLSRIRGSAKEAHY
ncbi:Crp/Fnr family transcriptional regulator [Hymenobacter segetis]|uniref:Crp/Fnr family transcriptional regulator n=1 Tax=Hymenobacter segetis TaxID=2025509 RepID=A0ABU9M0T5_9BACT